MKLLKVHGKKVSVMLLAIAVMLVPILQVGAASECPEKKKIYLFNDAENMVELYFGATSGNTSEMDKALASTENSSDNPAGYIELDGKILYQGTEYQSGKSLGAALVQVPYSLNGSNSTVTVHCAKDTTGENVPDICAAINQDHSLDGESKDYTVATLDEFMREIYRPNAGLWFTNAFVQIYGWKTEWKDALQAAGYNLEKVTVETSPNGQGVPVGEVSAISASGFQLRSTTDFINSIPTDAEIIEEIADNSWTEEDVNADIELELKNYKKDSSQYEEYAADENTSYVLHGEWANLGNNANHGDGSTVITGRLIYLNSLSVQHRDSFVSEYKNALITGADTQVQKFPSTLTSGTPSWHMEINRANTTAESSANTAVKIESDNDIVPDVGNNDNPWHRMPYANFVQNWVYIPAKYTITYREATCDDGNIVDTGTENPDSGVVSYAVIGTLLVGAASAYIYARKSNKFNKI